MKGYLHLKNWAPISLSSISTINQCFKKFKINSSTENQIVNKNSQVDVLLPNKLNGESKSCFIDIDKSINRESREFTDNSKNSPIHSSSNRSLSRTEQFDNSSTSRSSSPSILHDGKTDCVTVYEMLSHVVSFATLKIRVKQKEK